MQSSISFPFESSNSILYGFCFTEKYLVAVSKTAVVHSLQCKQCQRNRGQSCLNHHAVFEIGGLCDAQCHPKSNLMLTASGDTTGKMGLWNLNDGAHIRDFLHPGKVRRVLFLDEDYTFASALGDGVIMLWNRTEEEPFRVLRGHTEIVNQLIYHENLLISGSSNRTVRIWDLNTGDCICILDGHSNSVSVLNFNPDYSLLYASGGTNGEVRVWKWRTGELVAVCAADARTITQLTNIDGNLVTCGTDGKVRTWSPEGSLLKTCVPHEEAPVRGIYKTGKFAVTIGSKDGLMKVWDWENEDFLFNLQEQVCMVRQVITGFGKLATTWDENNLLHHIQVWELDEIEAAASEYMNQKIQN